MQLSLNQNQMVIQLDWYEQLLAFTLHNPITVSLDHLLEATAEEPQSRWTDLRAPGTHLPGVIKAGTYYTRHGREFGTPLSTKNSWFWNCVRNPTKRLC